MRLNSRDDPIGDVLFRLKRGLCAYVSYLAACEMNQAFSEYVLYEPILRILTARNYTVHCEYECPGIQQPKKGDKKRLDFYALKLPSRFALEVKWVKSRRLDTDGDTEKLQALSAAEKGTKAFLLTFGRKSDLERIRLDPAVYKEWGNPVYADLKKTRYGCRIFRLRESDSLKG